VPSDLVEQECADASAAAVRPQIEVFEQVSVEGGVAEDLAIAHRYPQVACLEQDFLDPRRDLLVIALLPGQVRLPR
jgi:hypothetical protein